MNILLLSTADWDHPFWTNKQHVAVTLSNAGHKVIYIDSLGLRNFKIAARDKSRIVKRLQRIFSSPRFIKPGLWVVSPLVIPGIQKGFLKWANCLLLRLTLSYSYLKLGFRCNILWTYSPATVLYFNPSDFKKSIYHCVDDIAVQPNMPTYAIKELEKLTASKVDHLVVTTKKLKEKLEGLCPSLHIMPNVVEYKHFANPSESSKNKAIKLMKGIPKPIIGFVGAISKYKIDFELLLNAVDTHREYSFVLVGSIGEGDEDTDVSELKKRSNVFFLGPQSYQDLPGFMSCFDVGILPSRRNEYTEAMFPMKFFEYLAAGLPVTAVQIPSLIPYRSLVTLCPDNKSFSKGISTALKSKDNLNEKEKRLDLARINSYVDRTNRMIDLLEK